ncbi:siderophore-interacting protein [Phycicoccus sonneratiae]|uniref:Siderophore-interacting protein n=1 Tax=Phycicoccus sonneratiae TaxID=2807628 RepID=A0ABS2CRD6_9MICO|nr:siderophore-interacting protein [Phycicoccus sonneraticus]MBM6401696.1 siderophore-interacting protein [Phycicoccus sonneraticus]
MTSPAALRATLRPDRATGTALVRAETPQFEATVVDVTDLGGGMRRIACEAPGLRSFVPIGPDEYVGLLMPPAGRPLVMPDPGPANVRAEVAALPEEDRPALRWYTIREHDPARGRLDIDVVTHGDSGPGSAWATRARRGDPVGIRTSGALYRGFEAHGRQVLVADETAVPSVAAILDAWGGPADAADHGVEVHVEVADPAVLDSYDLGDARVHVRTGRPGSAVVPALDRALDAGRGPIAYGWACGEADLATGARRTLVRHGADKASVFFCAYWKLGRPRP